ncbi:MAG: thioredoxin [Cyanobacteria bacterium SBLK]|nr:thioredoxin [Cyanobacteria bacterium SBLK]
MSKVVIISDANFEQEVFQAETPVLAYFWATWCGPCRLVAPSVEKISEQYGDRLKVVKMEIDPNPNAVKRCQVEGVPALRLIQGDQIVKSHEGAITKAALIEMIDECLNASPLN